MTDKIEILTVELLDQHRQEVTDFRALAALLHILLGWHYLLDLVWIVDNLGDPRGKRIMDAGAGLGVMQWYLMERGAAEVISADRGERSEIPLRILGRYNIRGLRKTDLDPVLTGLRKNLRLASSTKKPVSTLRAAGGLLLVSMPKRVGGRLLLYNQNLLSMPEIADNSLDAVVAVSALEHNSPRELEKVVAEIIRKIRPGGRLIATLGAAKEKDWFHEPSRGWNYTEGTLRRIFNLEPGTLSNYARHDELLATLKACTELRDNLAPFYSRSGDNGMPWGVWDPQYQPVGVCKTKPG